MARESSTLTTSSVSPQDQNSYPAPPHGPGPAITMASAPGNNAMTAQPGANAMASNHGNAPYMNSQVAAALKQQQILEQQKQQQQQYMQRQQLIAEQVEQHMSDDFCPYRRVNEGKHYHLL